MCERFVKFNRREFSATRNQSVTVGLPSFFWFTHFSANNANLFHLRFTTNELFLARANRGDFPIAIELWIESLIKVSLIKSRAKRIALHISRNQSYAKRKKIKCSMRSSKAPFSLFAFLYLSLCDLNFPLRNARGLPLKVNCARAKESADRLWIIAELFVVREKSQEKVITM